MGEESRGCLVMWECHTTRCMWIHQLADVQRASSWHNTWCKGIVFLHLQTFLLRWPASCHLPPPLSVCMYVCMCVCVSLCVVVGMQQDVFPVNSSACTMQHKGELSHVTNMVCQVTPMNYYSRSSDSHMICNSPLCLPDSSYPPSYLLIYFRSFIRGCRLKNIAYEPRNAYCASSGEYYKPR